MTTNAHRVAHNESLFRNVNEAIASQLARHSGLGEGPWLFICECASLGCAEQVELALEHYRLARAKTNRFAVVPGHVDPGHERVVVQGERFAIVEKFGEAGEHADELAGE